MRKPVVLVADDKSGRLRPCVSALGGMEIDLVSVRSPVDLFLTPYATDPSCVLASLKLDGLSITQFMAGIRTLDSPYPVVFVADPAELELGLEATQEGAFQVVKTPISSPEFEAVIESALDHGRRQDVEMKEKAHRNRELARLTAREREILPLLVAGMTDKEIGRRLGISHRTAERHRQNILDKFKTRTVVELVNKHFGAV